MSGPFKMMYGFCPMCGEPGLKRERRPNGNDSCINGHVYPTSTALKKASDFTKKDISLPNSASTNSSLEIIDEEEAKKFNNRHIYIGLDLNEVSILVNILRKAKGNILLDSEEDEYVSFVTKELSKVLSR